MKAHSGTLQISDRFCDSSDIDSKIGIETFFCNACFANNTFSNYTAAVIIPTLVEEMELIDVFVRHVFVDDTFWKHALAHDRW